MTLPLLFGNTSRDFQSCLDGIPFDSFQDLRRNGPVRPQAAERYTPVLAMIDMRSAAMVAWHLAVRAAVSNVKHFFCMNAEDKSDHGVNGQLCGPDASRK